MKNDPRDIASQRRGLLAKIHLAKKQLDLTDEMYQSLLDRTFGVKSAKALNMHEMERLVNDVFRSLGWIEMKRHKTKKSQILSLQERIRRIAEDIQIDSRRLRGLCLKICGVENPLWCQDPEKLKGLLAVLAKVKIPAIPKGGGDPYPRLKI